MFDDILELNDLFEKKYFENPLCETLKILNVLSNGLISKVDISYLKKKGCNLESIVDKRKAGIPIEYILGLGCFYGQTFICEPGALIPREETELLVNVTINNIKNMQNESVLNIVDMGTGCGSIAVSIALNTERTKLFASDLNSETVAIAKKNISKFKLEERITLLQGDLFAPLSGSGLEKKMDLVVCNPPYIPSTSLKNMASEIIENEPEEAFNGGSFGIEFYRRLIKDSLIYLKPEGLLIFEIGIGQEKLVSRLFAKNEGYKDLEYVDDGENVRVICARKTSSI